MKPDLSLFMELTDNIKFLDWFSDISVAMRATQLGIILSDTIYPNDINWVHRNNWLYYILRHKVKTDDGRSIIRQYQSNTDGRCALFHLYDHYTTSTTAQLKATATLAELTTRRLDDSWNKPIRSFIIQLVEDLLAYNDV